MSAEIWNAIAVVKDPRVQGRIDYPLGLILLVSLYATISGCDDWEQIEDYANIHSEDLRNLFSFNKGAQSDVYFLDITWIGILLLGFISKFLKKV